MAMLLLLYAANALPRNALGVGLSAVHVHHGLRGDEADADLAFVETVCVRLEVPLHVLHASVPDRVAKAREAGQPETVEEAARNLRYEIFRQLIAEGHADSILTAHTLDDQAETVLMKLLRGAWTEGLSGIHPVVIVPNAARPGKILRPLLSARRAELEEFLRNNISRGAPTPRTPMRRLPATAFAITCSQSSANTILRSIRRSRISPNSPVTMRLAGKWNSAAFSPKFCSQVGRCAAAAEQ